MESKTLISTDRSAHISSFGAERLTKLVVLFLSTNNQRSAVMPLDMQETRKTALTGVSDDVLNSANIPEALFNASIIWSASYSNSTAISEGRKDEGGRTSARFI